MAARPTLNFGRLGSSSQQRKWCLKYNTLLFQANSQAKPSQVESHLRQKTSYTYKVVRIIPSAEYGVPLVLLYDAVYGAVPLPPQSTSAYELSRLRLAFPKNALCMMSLR